MKEIYVPVSNFRKLLTSKYLGSFLMKIFIPDLYHSDFIEIK